MQAGSARKLKLLEAAIPQPMSDGSQSKMPKIPPSLGWENSVARTSPCFLDFLHGVKLQSPTVVAGLRVYPLLAVFLPCPTFLPSYCYFLNSWRNYLPLPSCLSMFLERSIWLTIWWQGQKEYFLKHIFKIMHMERYFQFGKSHYFKCHLHGYVPNSFEILT